MDDINRENEVNQSLSRRDLLGKGLLGLAAASMPLIGTNAASAARLMVPDEGSFNISFVNIHTGESFSGTYRVGQKYLPDAFERINAVLRDFRTNEEFPIDPRVIDIIHAVRQKTGTEKPLEILSGYRSPKTNAMLAKGSSGVAKNSLHMTGQAIDFRMPGFATRKLRDIAIDLRAGGVGYYRRSNFVHVDTGRVRQW